MKTNRYMAAGLLATGMMLTTACSDDFLEVKDPTGEPLAEYYVDDAHIQEALYAAYDPIHWPDWGLGMYNALNINSEVMTDNFFVGGEHAADNDHWQHMARFEATADKTLSSFWGINYSGVKRCNDLLTYLGYAKLTPENSKSYEVQARVMRAYYYNTLWHYFGNIPYYEQNLEPPYTAPQLKADEIYNNVISDLEKAIDENVLPMRWDNAHSGLASQAFAYMLYTEMVMYQNDHSRYAKAYDYMKRIIDDTADYGLNPDYANIWEESGEWSSESIWEINYDDNNNERGWNSPLAIGGTVLPTLIAPDGFNNADGTGFQGDGWGFLPVRTAVLSKFEAADKRLAATVWDVRGYSYKERFQDTHLWLNKYRPYDVNRQDAGFDNNLNYNNNYRYYRFAEALLNAAELALEPETSGTQGDADNFTNQVRRRAGLDNLSGVTKDDILNERDLEFMGEGKRYWDLVRTGKAATVLVPDGFTRTHAWTPNKKFLPIDQNELASDPSLVQNSEYFMQ